MHQEQHIDMARHTLRHSEFAGRIGVAREAITPPPGIYARLWVAPSTTSRSACTNRFLQRGICLTDHAGASLLCSSRSI